jgi:plasmid stabilization system protein ParE
MTSQYAFSEQARQDLKVIWRYIAKDSIDAADRLESDFYKAASALAEHPYMGQLRHDITELSLRFWNVRGYFIIYNPEARPLTIVRILSSYRDINDMLDD